MPPTWADRVDRWNRTFPKFAKTVYDHGWVYGVWYCGKNFKKNLIHGQYPATFLRRAKGLWTELPAHRCLHACAGSIQDDWVRLDLSPTFRPSVLGNVEQLPFRDSSFDLILYDPPYDQANADKYGVAPKPPAFARVLPEFVRVLALGGHFGVLHWYYPSYSRKKLGVKLVGLIAVVVGFCAPTRMFSIFEKVIEVRSYPEIDWPDSPPPVRSPAR
jgi:SAM-dependent methyltransferase